MAGREQERSEIEAFVLGFIGGTSSAKDVSALYISGSPGTGKTALVNATLANLAGQLEGVQVLAVNCMALDGVDAVWQRLAEMFGAGNKSPGRARKSKDSPQQIVETALRSSKQKWYVSIRNLGCSIDVNPAIPVLSSWTRWIISPLRPRRCLLSSPLRIHSLRA